MTCNMKLFLLFILLPGVSADKADYMGVVKDVKRIDRRLRTIEDNIAEEKMQRREDVQTILDKLSELQTTISVNNRNNKGNGSESTLDSKRSTQMVKQKVHAMIQEKKVNLRFRREVQDQLVQHCSVCASEFKLKMVLMEHLINDMSTKLTRYTKMSDKLVTDLSSIKDLITREFQNIDEKVTKPAEEVISKDILDKLTSLSDFRPELKSKMDFIEDRCIKDRFTELTRYNEMSNNFVTKTDLSYVKEVITNDIMGILTSMSDFRSEFKGKIGVLEDNYINDISTKLTRYTDMSRNLVTKTDLSSAEEVITRILQVINKKVTEFGSCLELYHAGFTTDGIYKIQIKGRYVDVYCDQTTDGGGWIVLQRRQDGSVDFYRKWVEYKHGFGDLEGEFWLGNDNLADLTEDCCHELRVELGDVDGNTRYAKYSEFRVLNEGSLYELNINGYSGNAGDSLGEHNNMKFSTKDADHDINDEYHCAEGWVGAGWFHSCYHAHLNGVYHASGYTEDNIERITWNEWKYSLGNGTYHSLTFSEMKLRRHHDYV